MRIVIIGRPGSGKSALTDGLVETDPGTVTFGVRRYFARAIAEGTPLGRAAEHVVRGNGWIPDEIVAMAVRQEVDRGQMGGSFILEGMPGNRRQAELLDELLDEAGLPLHAAVHVDTPAELCLERASRRLVCEICDGGSHQVVMASDGHCRRCGTRPSRRPTDVPDKFGQRLAQHAKFGPELLGYYRPDRLIELSNLATPTELAGECRRLVAARIGLTA